MAFKETIRDRQNSEFEVIKSIYGSDVEDLRNKADGWKPLDLRIRLTPLKGSSGDQKAYVWTKLHVTCPNKYPKVIPKIVLEETKGIADSLIEELKQELHQQAASLKGEVMIYDLAQIVQAFLHKHNKPPSGSFYDEMLQERQKREQELLDRQKLKETEEQQNLREMIQKRKEVFKNERKRREPRRSISESNAEKHRQASSSESSENSSPYCRSHVYPNKCSDHRNSDMIYFPKVGRQIRRGCCLGHSQKGYIAFSGIDVDTGQLLYITEWNIRYSYIEQNFTSSSSHDQKASASKVDDFINDIEKQIAMLTQIRHRNLIHYECVMCLKKKEGLFVYLVQDFVLGTSISSITASLGWCAEGASMVAKGVLDALIYLHNKGVSHNHLFDSTVFMDNTGTIRCTDFSIVQNLLDLNGGQKTDKDLPALGVLIESLIPTQHSEMRDFIDKCKSDRTLSASDLLEHPFLRPSRFNEAKTKFAVTIPNQNVEKSLASYFPQPTFTAVSQSRLHTEFEVLQWLGKGAYGDVLKVRNILDNREYAIKRIPLPARSRQLYRKMTREVEVLSRLNHENVVRYFTSWIETATTADLEDEKLGTGDWSYSQESYPKPNTQIVNAIDVTGASSSSSICFMPNIDDSDSDGIEFVDSNGEVAVYNENDEDSDSEGTSDEVDVQKKPMTPKPVIQIMYIQMEFCEKFTLRAAIDDNLYENEERVWRLFREIAEGLAHIHQQGMIHRDLKPVNIFLDSRDQIKIGDFGLATTSFLALQCHDQSHVNGSHAIEFSTGTGKVGTTLYVAPELTGNASKSIYNQKVDMYTLGIILFEMCNPPFETGMERVKTILSLRNPSIIVPEKMLNDPKHASTVEILCWLLNHDPAQRPTAEELLASDLVPVAQFEVTDLHEMLRHILANPQSKAYKHLVARCLQQECDKVLELTYHLGLVTKSSVLELAKNKVINLFRKHGAIEMSTPLLTPFSKNTYVNQNPVKLMTHSGSVVILPNDLHAPFARYIAMSGANMVRRYSVNRVYREKKVFNFHPKQNYECAFDIITPNPGNHLVDAELLSVAYEMVTEIPILKQKNINIRMNHTSLLRAILLNCNVPDKKYDDLFESMLDFIEGRKSKFHLHSSISSIMETSKTSVTVLMDLLLADFPMGGPRGYIESSALKTLIRGKGEAASLAKVAIRELETVVSLAQSFGVTCPIHVYAGLPIGYNRASSGGIVWQMLGDLKPNRAAGPSVFAVGERYDTMLAEYQKQAQMCNVSIPHRPISGAGMSFSLDKLVAAVEKSFEEENRNIDIVVCVSGSRPPLKDVTYILRLLWSAGIRSGVVEATSPDEAQDFAKDLGAAHFILLAEGGVLRVRSWDQGRFHERSVNRTELVEYVQRMLKSDTQQQADSTAAVPLTSTSSGTGLNHAKSSYISQLPNVQVMFMTHEKMTANMRRRMENQVTQQMATTLQQFGRKENFNVIVADLPPAAVNAIIGAINPRGLKEEIDKEMSYVYERFSKHKRYIISIYDEILDILSEKNSKPIVALYSTYESYFRVII